MEKIDKILVPLDGSEWAETSLPLVEKLATDLQAVIALLRVAYAHTFPGVDPTDAQVKVVGEAEEYLGKIERQLVAEGFKVETHVRYGHDADEILSLAVEADIDLIGAAGPAPRRS